MLVHFSQSAFPRSSDLQPCAENSTIDPSLCFHLNAKFIKNAHTTIQSSRKNANLYLAAVPLSSQNGEALPGVNCIHWSPISFGVRRM